MGKWENELKYELRLETKNQKSVTHETKKKLVYQLSVDEGNGRREGDNSWLFER